MTRFPTFFAAVLMLLSSNASALEVVEKEGIYIYFPKHEAALAARLVEPLPGVLAFLSDKGLFAKPPLHVVLDDWRDIPTVNVEVRPYKEIRIPVRAPGVLEDEPGGQDSPDTSA